MGRHIFLSYSRIDKALVPPLLKGLDRLRHDVWLDEQLEGGQQWWDEVLGQLRGCDLLLLCVSEAMLDSDACKAELRYAQALGKPVLPVALESLNADLLPSNLARLQLVDYTPTNPQAPFDLMAALERLPEPPALPDPLPDPPAVPISYLSGLGELVHQPSLTLDQQYAVVQKLRTGLHRPRDREGVIELMRGMREREDLYVSTSRALGEAFEEAARTAPAPAPFPGAAPVAGTSVGAGGLAASHAAAPSGPTVSTGSVPPAGSGVAGAPTYPPAPPPSQRRPSRRKPVLIGLGIAVLLAAGAGIVASLYDPSNTVGAVGDACLVGTWRSNAITLGGDSSSSATGGGGLALTITNDGEASYDFSAMDPVVATVNGSESKVEFTGTMQTTVRAPSPGVATETIVSNAATFQLFTDGQQEGSPTAVSGTFLERYSCSSTRLSATSGTDTVVFERQ